MPLKISTVTATLNRHDFLPACIESVASQSYPYKEHLIIDGGSTDGTVEMLQEYSTRYPHIRWISEPDNGPSDAFNKGLKLASGDLIGVLGDDDCYAEGAFEAVAAAAAANIEAGLIAGHCRYVRDDGSTVRVHRASWTNRRDLIAFWWHWDKRVFLPAPSTFIRRHVIEEIGGFEERDKYAMDYRHWIKITSRYPVYIIDRELACFRYSEGTISHSLSEKQRGETLAISKEYWREEGTSGYYRLLFSFVSYSILHTIKRILKAALKPLRARRHSPADGTP